MNSRQFINFLNLLFVEGCKKLIERIEMLRTIFVLFFLMYVTFTSSKIVMLPDDKIEKCVEAKYDAESFDISGIEIVVESDTDIFLNGSMKNLKTVGSPMKVRIYFEKYTRSQWTIANMDRRIRDFCAVLHSPAEVWYEFFKDVWDCPFSAGVSESFCQTKLKHLFSTDCVQV
jgi:hypothetical protein